MTYPPPGGENPQYQLQPEPQQPSDPYMQPGYSTPPPPGNYYQQQPPPQYTQPPTQPGMMPPQVGVHPGYPSAPGTILPPPLPQPKQGGSLAVILAVVVGLVVVLGVAAVLIIPGMLEDEEQDPQAGGDPAKTEAVETTEEATEAEPEPTAEEETPAETDNGDFATWGTPINSDEYTSDTAEGAAINYRLASETDDDELLQSLICASPSEELQFDVDWQLEYDGTDWGFLLWSMSREVDDGVEVWVGWTMDDSEPSDQDEMEEGVYEIYKAVEEDGQWKLCDLVEG
ncbi:MAG TPA: hypothetical protein VHG10_00910 [Glycomyces sp.]|nr:hypothetical protein [Glycomyces sp.]